MNGNSNGEHRAHRDEIFSLIDSVNENDHLGRMGAFQEAARIADEHNDGAFAYSLRMELIKVSGEANRRDVQLVAFAWCLNYADKEKGGPDQALLWRYKWVIDGLTAFPEISVKQIDSTLEDMARRYRDAGYGLKAYHQLRLTSRMDMGMTQEVEGLWKEWEHAEPDTLQDCEACQLNARTWMNVRLGKLDEAMRVSEPLLAGKLKCEEVPELTVGDLLFPLVRAGRVEKARRVAEMKVRRLLKQPDLLLSASYVMAFMALDDQLPRALKMLETLSRFAGAATNVQKQMHFYAAAGLVLMCLEKAGRGEVTLRLDAQMPGYRADMGYETRSLSAAFLGKAKEIAARFDVRNGNPSVTGLVGEYAGMAGYFPLVK